MNTATKKVFDYVTDSDSMLRWTQDMIAQSQAADLSQTWLHQAAWTLMPADKLAERFLGKLAMTEDIYGPLQPWQQSPITRCEFEKVDWEAIVREIARPIA